MPSEQVSRYLEILGDSPQNRVLDTLMRTPLDLNLTEIARQSNVGYSTLQLFWPKFLEGKIVLATRKMGKATLYKLNPESDAIVHWRRLWKSLSKHP